DHAPGAEPLAEPLEESAPDAMAAEELRGVRDDLRLGGCEARGRLPAANRGDRLEPHAGLLRERHVRGPLVAAVHGARRREDCELALGAGERRLEADVGAEVGRALGHLRAVEQHRERAGDPARVSAIASKAAWCSGATSALFEISGTRA